MATLMEIEEAIKSIETKKQSLKQSFDHLLQHSHSLSSSFSLSWPKIDSHFSQIHSSLQSRFSLLQQNHQSLPQFHHQDLEHGQKIQSLVELERTPDGKNPKNDQKIQSLPKLGRTPDGKNPRNGQKEQSLSRLEKNEADPDENSKNEHLKSVCEEMDSKKLRTLVKICIKLKGWGANELSQALKYAPDPYKLVLDATEEVVPRGSTSVIMLESLLMIEGIEVSEEIRDRAKCMAIKWNDELDKEDKFPFDALSLLTLLAAFKLVNDFDKDDVLELFYITSKNARALNLLRVIGLEDRVPELVQKLIASKRVLIAIRYVQEFKLADQFSCVGLLKSYLKDCQTTATQIRKYKKNDPRAMIDGDEKEKAALNIVIKYIKDYKLEFEFPPENLQKRLEKLDEMRDKRRNKKLKKKMVALEQHEKPANYTGSVSAPPQQHYLQPPLFPVGPPPGVGPSSIGPYGIPGPMTNDPLGLSGPFLSYASSPSTVGPRLNTMGSQLPSSSHQGPSHFVDAYVFPLHHPPFHRQ